MISKEHKRQKRAMRKRRRDQERRPIRLACRRLRLQIGRLSSRKPDPAIENAIVLAFRQLSRLFRNQRKGKRNAAAR